MGYRPLLPSVLGVLGRGDDQVSQMLGHHCLEPLTGYPTARLLSASSDGRRRGGQRRDDRCCAARPRGRTDQDRAETVSDQRHARTLELEIDQRRGRVLALASKHLTARPTLLTVDEQAARRPDGRTGERVRPAPPSPAERSRSQRHHAGKASRDSPRSGLRDERERRMRDREADDAVNQSARCRTAR